jgi:hypothetical protein
MSLPRYFITSGNVKVATIDGNGAPGVFRDVGEAPSVEFDATVEFADNFSTGKSGPNRQDLHSDIKNTAALTLMLKERSAQNLELILGGTSASENAGSYTANEAFPSGIVNGDECLIPGEHVGISTLVIKDSLGATVTSTKYSVNPDAPLVTFLDVAGYTQPFKAFSYDYVTSTKVTLLQQALPELCVLIDGHNLAPGGERIFARIDRVSFAPATKFSFKSGSATGTSNTVDEYELKGVCLVVPGKTSYGSYRQGWVAPSASPSASLSPSPSVSPSASRSPSASASPS